jgi:ubiquinone biosynthesis monooxygenase Coq7
MKSLRQYTFTDQLVIALDTKLKGLNSFKKRKNRQNPSNIVENTELDATQCQLSAGLMRVNHAGEVCAQALYQGQALTADNPEVRRILLDAADEESDHLHWCRERLEELGSHTSYLNPLWYAGSFSMGTLAGLLGDAWNLGFVAETERQVESHLESHLDRLPEADLKSRKIIEQMKYDEAGHAAMADRSGARELPGTVKELMRVCAKLMTRSAYWV